MSTKTRIPAATAEEGRAGEVRDSGAISNDLHALEKWIARLRKAYVPDVLIRACYKMGGFGIARPAQAIGRAVTSTQEVAPLPLEQRP